MKNNQKTPLFTEIPAQKAASINGGCPAQCLHSRSANGSLGARSK